MRDIFLANAFAIIADRHPQDFVRIAICSGDRRDPFRLIQDMSFYERSRDNDLVDEFRLYDSGTPLTRFWEGHSMIESYIANNREAIVSWLLP